MSFSGLKSFLDNEEAKPPRKTRERVARWYLQRSKNAGTSDADAETAMAFVVTYLRDKSKPRAVRERQLRAFIDRLKDETP